ncbi:hypothetical protein ON010_g8701 [Phytophthora cinnamomi]|nr:hypothetical protein ON010_g8701 [Phytophthora cinnamomi]
MGAQTQQQQVRPPQPVEMAGMPMPVPMSMNPNKIPNVMGMMQPLMQNGAPSANFAFQHPQPPMRPFMQMQQPMTMANGFQHAAASSRDEYATAENDVDGDAAADGVWNATATTYDHGHDAAADDVDEHAASVGRDGDGNSTTDRDAASNANAAANIDWWTARYECASIIWLSTQRKVSPGATTQQLSRVDDKDRNLFRRRAYTTVFNRDSIESISVLDPNRRRQSGLRVELGLEQPENTRSVRSHYADGRRPTERRFHPDAAQVALPVVNNVERYIVTTYYLTDTKAQRSEENNLPLIHRNERLNLYFIMVYTNMTAIPQGLITVPLPRRRRDICFSGRADRGLV